MFNRWTIVASLLVLSLSLFFCIPFAMAKSKKNQFNQPIVVEVAHVVAGDIPKSIEALGTLSAVQNVTISSEISGRISEINFKNGETVAKGMPIVQLNNQQAQADYQTAVTGYQLALQKYNRSKNLVNEAISRQDFAIIQAGVATAESDVQSKLADLNAKRITAPFSGVLGAFQVQTGDYVKDGDPLVTLVNTTQLRADYNIPEQNLAELKAGQLVTIKTSAYPNQVFYGTVSFISPIVSPDSRMVAVQALIDNSKGPLLPGMFVRLSEQLGLIKNAVIIPASAISADIKGYYVFKVEGTKVAQTYITTGMQVGAKTQVLNGLQVGDTIVIAGQQKLQDGSMITVAPQ